MSRTNLGCAQVLGSQTSGMEILEGWSCEKQVPFCLHLEKDFDAR